MVMLVSYLKCVTTAVIVSVATGCAQQSADIPGALSTQDGIRFRVVPVMTDLEVPWSIAFHDEDIYVTERAGKLKVLKKGEVKPSVIATIDDVHQAGEGGLMGLAFHPKFAETRFVYLSYTCSKGGSTLNKVMRYHLGDTGLTDPTPVIEGIPGGGIHNGSRIRFGPDGKLYITTGDAAQRQLAQDLTSLAGKILRVNDDGSIPADNPFPGSPVYSLGHRNPQGLDWQPVTGTLLSSEHGPSGFDGPGGGDEINIISPGMNYGWPVIHHQQAAEGMSSPLLEFTPAIAPSGASFSRRSGIRGFAGNLFVATLRGRHLLRVVFDDKNPEKVVFTERLLEGMLGRIRDVVEGPDGLLYIATSNRDGRGSPQPDDDRILKIVPAQ